MHLLFALEVSLKNFQHVAQNSSKNHSNSTAIAQRVCCHDAKVMYSNRETGLVIECKCEEWYTERGAILAPAIKGKY